MFEPSDRPRIFALAPGVAFPQAFVAGLLERSAGQPPEALARTVVFLNTARMARHVRDAFVSHGTRLLPRIRLITDLAQDPIPGLAPAVPPLRRRLELSRLVAALAVRTPDLTSGKATYDLSASLADLMAEMHGEGISPDDLDRAELAGDHAAHWERSLAFIRIVGRYFAADAPPDPDARLRRVVADLMERWRAAPPDHPVVVAGSTGSRGTTAMLIDAVARLPQGAVVLPGFDFEMPASAWNSLCSGPIPQEDHPQYRFADLCQRIGIDHREVRSWVATSGAPPSPARNRLVSLALRPAPMTDAWMQEGAKLHDIADATQDLGLILAPSPRDEGLAIALALREAAEQGARAALVSPDRTLTRRVAAALDRWGILPDDSAGEPLSQTAPGRFLRQIAGLFGQKVTAGDLLALLKHPLTATGNDRRGPHMIFARDLERDLRRFGPALPGPDDLIRWAGRRGGDDRIAWAAWIAGAMTGLDTPGDRDLPSWVALLRDRAETLSAGPDGQAGQSELWRKAAGDTARRVMDQLGREAPHGSDLSPAGFSDLVRSILAAEAKRDPVTPHPLISIWGTLEARVQGADLVILAGLNEGVWPEAPPPDPWLSRQMRLAAGLLLPERKIGLSAHDFQQAIAAPRVILSRALRDADSETVPSRWLARLMNLLQGLPERSGPAALDRMTERGQRYLDLARALDRAGRTPPAPRPAPRPPIEARPRKLPVTAIRTLALDPYAVYARHILGLRRLDPLVAEPDPGLRGEALHKVMERFLKEAPPDEPPDAMRARLLATTDTVLAEYVPWVATRRLWRARIARIADWFVTGEAARGRVGRPVVLETGGAAPLHGIDFTLTARPDRIDALNDGRVHIFDYKTGAVPSASDRKKFDRQLLLEAGIARHGGFAALGPREVAAITYIGLGGDGAEVTETPDEATINRALGDLERLVRQYQSRGTGYVARLFDRHPDRPGDYDGVSRYGEWAIHDLPIAEDVG